MEFFLDKLELRHLKIRKLYRPANASGDKAFLSYNHSLVCVQVRMGS